MRFDKLTLKAQEAVQAAQSLADQESHQAMEPEHLLLALIQQQEGVVGPVLATRGPRHEAILRAVTEELAKLPKVRGGGGQYVSPRLKDTLDRAWREAERLTDEDCSPEH